MEIRTLGTHGAPFGHLSTNMLRISVVLCLLLTTALAAEDVILTGRSSGDVYDLVTLYHHDTLDRLNTLEDRMDGIDASVANSTAYLVWIEEQEQAYIEYRTQPFVLNFVNIVFQALMFCLIGYLFARHERRLLVKYGVVKEAKKRG